MTTKSLKPAELYITTNPNDIDFTSTHEVEKPDFDIIGQSRALDAIEFGIGMRHNSFNLYVSGSTGLGKHSVIKRILLEYAEKRGTPSDWCYVGNFDEFYKPQALELPKGTAVQLRDDMTQLIDDLLVAVPAAFESDEYRTRAQEIEEEIEEYKERAFKELNDKANIQKITLLNTPTGYTLVPLSDDHPMPPNEFNELPEEKRKTIQEDIDELSKELKALILKIPEWQKDAQDRFKELNTEFAKTTVEHFLKTLSEKYANIPQATQHLNNVREDIIKNMHLFIQGRSESSNLLEGQSSSVPAELRRYEINILVNNAQVEGAPVIYENNPTYNNLVGRIEHIAQEGALVTDFTLIKPGALHRANGGYLILDMDKLLMNPFAWQGLKRVLYANQIRLESLERMLSLVSTITLEPADIPLDVKVILVGDRYLYHMLKMYDEEFGELFKVTADFSESFDRTPESVQQLAHLIASIAHYEKVLPLNRYGVARVIEHCSRQISDAEKLSLHMGMLKDLILEADYQARKSQADVVANEHVQQAIDAKVFRSNQIHERMQEQILRHTVLIDTDGERIAQVNGLSVYQMGDNSFGQPTRITATARLGNGKVIDIERETKLGGNIHSKGVIILTSCLANRYARNRPLYLSASLVFEQSYGGVDGDSASIAEFCVLVSAMTSLPIKQNFAVTGSINQHGDVQAIGGVNHKIEGFFDICKSRGLTGEQGVIIPASNAKHLMLHKDVVDAVNDGLFQVHTVETIDDALEVLLGMPAGEADSKGEYPEGTINHAVVKRLEELHRLHKQYGKPDKKSDNKDTTSKKEAEENNTENGNGDN